MEKEIRKCGYVALLGRPNVGKSTLLNRLIGRKIAIVSRKPQTTRNRILGILSGPGYQIVFLDTPGFHKPKHKLGEYMVNVSKRAAMDADVNVFMVDAAARPEEEFGFLEEMMPLASGTAILAINKVDLVRKQELLPLIDLYNKRFHFEEIVPISAISGDNVDRFLEVLIKYLPESQMPFYPEDFLTDLPERFIAAEIIREKILELTGEEVPHATAVLVQEFKERGEDLIYIRADIIVEREGQKGIMIGEGGKMLKKIGSEARKEIEAEFGKRVYLDLWVKVRKNWRKDPVQLRSLGYA
jgi:GTP-binding protein Era